MTPRRTSRVRRIRGRHVVCVSNEGVPASLERGKIYRTLPDAKAALHGLLRVIDETGEDYLFDADCFEVIEVSRRLARALALTG